MTDLDSAKLAAMFGLAAPTSNEADEQSDPEFDERFAKACETLVEQMNELLPTTRDPFTIDVQLSVLAWMHTVAIVRRATQSLVEEGQTTAAINEIMFRSLQVLKYSVQEMAHRELPAAMRSLTTDQP